MSIFPQSFCRAHQSCHVPIVSTHVSVVRLRLVRQTWVVLRNGKSVEITPQSYSFHTLCLPSLSFHGSHDVHREPRLRIVFDPLAWDAILGSKRLSEQFVSLELPEATLWPLMNVVSQLYHRFYINEVLEDFSVLFVQG